MRIWGLAVGVCLALFALVGPPQAAARARSSKCRNGTVQVKIGKKKTCLSSKLALPPPSKSNALVAGVQGALTFTELSFRTNSGKQVKSFSQVLGSSWATARGRLENATTAIIARAQKSARRPLADFAVASAALDSCAVADVVDD